MTADHPRLIGFAGAKRAGKNTAAEFDGSAHAITLAFADPLRNLLAALDPPLGPDGPRYRDRADGHLAGRYRQALQTVLAGTPAASCSLGQVDASLAALNPCVTGPRLRDVLDVHGGWEAVKAESCPHREEIRSLLQRQGTEALRDVFGANTLLAATGAHIMRLLDEGFRVIVTDVRFDDEARLIHDLGGTVLEIVRPALATDSAAEDTHRTEAGVSRALVDHIIVNDASPARLHLRIRDALAGRTIPR